MRRLVALAALLAPVVVSADSSRCLSVDFTPADRLQIVVWLEDGSGNFVDTLFITQQTGTFGLGNRPGRFDFNSGPMWPYGRRITTFPVWAHRNEQHFPSVLFQNNTSQDPGYCQALDPSSDEYELCADNDLSHSFDESSHELHYCRPMTTTDPGWDAMTCATATPFSDKGVFSNDSQYDTGYPPRADLTPASQDSPSVAMYKALNPYDAVSQPTPIGGTSTAVPWPVPDSLPDGNYVMYIEVSQESDFNATYTTSAYPAPVGIPYGEYGVPYRGQPSIVYEVPFTLGGSGATASTSMYSGYGDPDGNDGNVRAPDDTITTDTPGTGASRLQLVADGSAMYRARVKVGANAVDALPAAPQQLQASDVTGTSVTMTFVAPGIGMPAAEVAGYEIRYRADDAMTADNFDDSTAITTMVPPLAPGGMQTVDITGLLPLTEYWVGVRAYDGCHNPGELTIAKVTTADRQSGEVDACFVATAAYGSIMANDVELLRHFRDSLLERTVIGELGVEAYYTFGPAAAGVISESDLLRETARAALAPLIRAIRPLRF